MAFIFTIYNIKSIPKVYSFFSLVIFIGIFIYCILWFSALKVYDYYLINTLILLPFFLPVFFYLKNKNPEVLSKPITRIAIILILWYNIAYATGNFHMRYFTNLRNKYWLAGYRLEVGYFKWFSNTQNKPLKGYEDITSYLRSIGINEDDKVIFLNNDSNSISLYLIDNCGLTNIGGRCASTGLINEKKSN